MADDSNTAKGTAYECFVQELYQTLHDAEGFDTIKVEHNIELIGRSGCAHQIDVFWEFRVAGQVYKTAIECKAYMSNVSIGRIRDFYGVLADVPNLRGVFVSLIGFQSGAKQYADHYGIALNEIREPTEDDWKGRIRDKKLRPTIIVPEIRGFEINATKAYLDSLAPDANVEAFYNGTSHDPVLFDVAGNPVASIEQIRQMLPHDRIPETGRVAKIPFPGCVWRTSNGIDVPIDSITARYDVLVDIQHTDILGKAAAKAIMKDVKGGTITFFYKDGGVKQVRS